ncbi:MAG: protein kinase [Gemmataceae bacterium]
MASPTECPHPEHWLFCQEQLTPQEWDRIEIHVEGCPVCQAELDADAGLPGSWIDLGRELGDPTHAPTDPTLSLVLDRLHELSDSRSDTGPPRDLPFLEPSSDPGVLGLPGKYEVIEEIGRGGMGVVLKAFDTQLNRLVAIKVLAAGMAGSDTARVRFTREARAAAAVCHDHVVAVHSVDEVNGLPYLVMQYIAGESLQDRLDRVGPLEIEDVLRIGHQTSAGLAAAHAQGLIHRDIKPANLLLENGLSRVKITDFGLARLADDIGLTQEGVVAGTPAYMSPEQARGEPVDHRTDLFSLGCVLYTMCAGRSPFTAETTMGVLRRVCESNPTPLSAIDPRVPPWLEELINRLLEKDPSRRLQSAAEVTQLLEGYLAHRGQPATVRPPALPALPWQWPLKPPVLLAVLAAVILVGLSLLLQVAPVDKPRSPAGPNDITELYHDFRKSQQLPSWLQKWTINKHAVYKNEPEGLRLTIPAVAGNAGAARIVNNNLSLAGDFELTATFQLIQADPASNILGAGVLLNLAVDQGWTQGFVRLGRVLHKKHGDGWAVQYVQKGNPEDYAQYWKAGPPAKPAEPGIGRMKALRQGSRLHLLIAQGASGEFETVLVRDCPPVTFQQFSLQIGSNDDGCTADGRLIDLRVRFPQPVAGASDPPAELGDSGQTTRSHIPLFLAGGLAVTLLAGVGLYLVWRMGRPRAAAKVSAPAPAVPKPVATPKIPITCSACGKTFSLKTTLAGKKGKCTCGAMLQIPSLRTEEA